MNEPIEQISMNAIKIDAGTQVRAEINASVVAQYAERMGEGDVSPARTPDRAPQSARALPARECSGCRLMFEPSTDRQRHCRPSCRAVASRQARADRLFPDDPARAE